MTDSDNGRFFAFNQRTNTVTAGVMLVVLYAICVYLVVISFSAYVIRTDWNGELADSGSEVTDLDNLIYLIKQDENLQSQINDLQAQIEATNERIARATATRDTVRTEAQAAELGVSRLLQQGEQHLKRLLPRLEVTDRDALEPRLAARADISAGLTQIASAAFLDDVPEPEITKARETAARIATDLEQANSKSRETAQSLEGALSDMEREHEMRSHHLKRQSSVETAREKLLEKLPADSEFRARWVSLGGWGFINPLPSLVKSQTIMVTLLATIAAGALGTLVAYSRTAFLDLANPRVSRLLITLGEGIAAAIGIFLFAGSGMLMLTQGGGSEGRLELSPFTVAFLAFVSGFMAESAFSSIAKFGRSVFSADKSKPEDKPETDQTAEDKNGDTTNDAAPVAETREENDAPRPATGRPIPRPEGT
ncbi:hypothetical protein ACOXXX_01435 [Thalassococcus sp. BH17M4-6]|uniref:hypothetical protein n=1 Tax=Thalassococcus sp. BH17M4-6 TaxID=3413148 RepID=UPI003BEB3A74